MKCSLVTIVGAACALSLAPVPPPLSAATAMRGPGAVIGMHQKLLRAIDAADLGKALSFLHEDMNMDKEELERPCTLFLVDARGVPRSARGYEESKKVL